MTLRSAEIVSTCLCAARALTNPATLCLWVAPSAANRDGCLVESADGSSLARFALTWVDCIVRDDDDDDDDDDDVDGFGSNGWQ